MAGEETAPEQSGTETEEIDPTETDGDSGATPGTASPEETIAAPTQSASPPTGSPPAPAPTASNPGTNPGGGSSSSASSQPLNFGTVNASPNTTVHYGTCTAGEPTLLHVEAVIEPVDQVKRAVLWYDIFNQGGAAASGSEAMWQLGIGDFAGDIDIGQIGPGSMGSTDGSISFWIEAVHEDGSSAYSSTYSVDIQYCPDAVVGNPPVAPPAIVSFTDNGPVQAGEWVELAWQTTDAACGVTLDGGSVDADGYFSYGTSAGDAGKTFTHTLVVSGEPCSNPVQVSETVSISITPAVTISTGSGTLYDEHGLDLDSDGSDDIMFDVDSSDTLLLALFGTQVIAGSQPDIASCKTAVGGGGYGAVSIEPNDLICFLTGSGYFGYITVNGMYIDLDNYLNTNVDLSYTTELVP